MSLRRFSVIGWWGWAVLGIVVSALLYIGFIKIYLPQLICRQAVQQVADQLGGRLSIAQITVGLWNARADLSGLRLYTADPKALVPVVSIDRLSIDVSAMSLWRRAIVIQKLTVDRPSLFVSRISDGRWNVSPMLDRWLSRPPGPPQRFSLNNLRLQNGLIVLDDRVNDKRLTLSELGIGLPFISNFPEYVKIDVLPAFSAKLNGQPLEIAATTRLFDRVRTASLLLRTTEMPLADFGNYLPLPTGWRLRDGRLSTELQLMFSQAPGQPAALSLSGKAAIDDFALQTPDAPLLKWHRLAVDVAGLDWARRHGRFRSLALAEPQLILARQNDGSLTGLPQSTGSQQGTLTEPGMSPAPWRLDVDALTLVAGAIEWRDTAAAAGADGFRGGLSNLRLDLRRFSTHSEQPARFQMQAETPQAGRFQHEGELIKTPAGWAANGRIGLENVALMPYRGYLQTAFGRALTARQTTGRTDYRFDWSPGRTPGLSLIDLQMKLNDIALSAAVQPVVSQTPGAGIPDESLQLSTVTVTAPLLDFAAHRFHVATLALDGLSLGVQRHASGVRLEGYGELQKTATLSPARVLYAPAAQNSASDIRVDRVEISRSRLHWTDTTAPEKISAVLDQLSATAGPWQSRQTAALPIRLAARFDGTGRLQIKGTVKPNGAAQADVDLQNLSFVFLQAYVADQLNMRLVNGALNGKFHCDMQVAPFKLAASGALDIRNLKAVDKIENVELLGWQSLSLKSFTLAVGGVQPVNFKAEQAALTGLRARVIVGANGRVNLQNIVSRERTSVVAAQPAMPAPAVVALPASAVPRLTLDVLTLTDGAVRFTDNFIQPHYSADLTELSGRIGPIASYGEQATEIQIAGSVDGDGVLDIKGQANLFAKPLQLDIAAKASDLELTRLSPYAQKYAGYAIEKGKLSTEVRYRIDNGRLNAQNRLFLDQLTFGDKVDSVMATTLPVRLAVSLLKNSRGEIDLNLPISGSIDDPEFNIGAVIWKALGNLLARAVTAPFSLLGHMGDTGGESLAYIEFEPGQTSLTPAARVKLDGLVKVLHDKPSLRLDIAGYADPQADADGLRKQRLIGLKAVAAQELRDLAWARAVAVRAAIEASRQVQPERLFLTAPCVGKSEDADSGLRVQFMLR
ncbi:MAG: DUF748 domain-containing protein [Burkholderiaceae bacterium]